jgi:signal transduction histidine kinase
MRPDAMSERVQRTVVPLHRSVEQLNPARDMVERQRAGDELARSADQLQTLAQLLLEAREDERRRLAQELHDRVGQNLTALGLNLNVIRGALPSDVSWQVGELLDECLRLVEHTVEIVSDVMAELRSVVPDDTGLLPALRRHAQQFFRRTGVPVRVLGSEHAPRLSAGEQNAMLRIAQEALTNAAKHARAAQVSLTLQSSAERVRMIVADDGCGFDTTASSSCEARQGFGLRIMRERAEAVGARFRVESRLGTGGRVIMEVRR